MGAFQGNLMYKLFFVEGELPESWKDQFLQSIRKYAFEPVTPDSEEEEMMGWVSVLRPLQTDFVLKSLENSVQAAPAASTEGKRSIKANRARAYDIQMESANF